MKAAQRRRELSSRNASFQEGVFAGALFAPLKLGFVLLLSLVGIVVVAWIVDWIFVLKVWPEGVGRLKGILAADLARAIELAEWQNGVSKAVTGTANFMYGLVFGVTGIHDMGMRFAEGAELSIPDTIVRTAYLANTDAIEVAMIGTQLLGVRLATLAMMSPLVVLVYLVAAADGLTQRAIRRACGGRESASLYHRAKHLQVMLLAMGGVLVLIQPVSIDPRLVGVPVAFLVGILARLQWACYKKHL
jgi:integrating conjugative element membrane protein (TIGR03747 family)